MATYTVFIGAWDEDGDPDWVHLRVEGLSWDAAQKLLTEHLARWEHDDCEDCRIAAKEAAERLASASPGRFEDNVDGDDYMILEEPR